MRLLDRYVFFLFAKVFLICFVCLTGIYIVGDFVNNLNEFIEIGGSSGGLLPVLGRYYGARAPWFFEMTGRIVALISAVFAITWLQRHNEMTALMAAGISRRRIIAPLLLGAIGISVLGIGNREWLIPRLQEQLRRTPQDWLGNKPMPVFPCHDHMTDIQLGGKSTVVAEEKIVQPNFRLPSSMGHLGRQLTAEEAYRRAATAQHPAGYLLVGVQSPEDWREQKSVFLDGQPLLLLPGDTPWLKENECFVVSDVTFAQLTGGRAWRQFSSTATLIAGLQNPSLSFGADVRVTIHARIVQPILDLCLFFLGIPVVLSRESRNVFVAAGSCVAIVTVFFVVALICENLGTINLISPALAAWLPLMLFVPWAVAISRPLQR